MQKSTDVYYVSKGNDGWEINGPDCLCLTIGGDYLNADLAKRTCEHLNIAYGMGFKYGGEDERRKWRAARDANLVIRLRRVFLSVGVIGVVYAGLYQSIGPKTAFLKVSGMAFSLLVVLAAARTHIDEEVK